MTTKTRSGSDITTKNKEKDESEDCSHSDKEKKHKFDLDPDLKAKLLQIPGALEYIQKLEKLVARHVKKINKLRNKLQRKAKCKDVCCQTESETCDGENVDSHNKPKSLADDIKEAAESAMQNTGFVYEETSGMYYDYNTGYYYNAEYGLYYDGTTGTYMTYNQDTQSYEFHSQVSTETKEQEHKETRKHQKRKSKSSHSNKVKSSSDLEALSHSFNKMSIDNLQTTALDISKQWPPCMRLIVESTDLPRLKRGSLHIVTCSGGTVGREGPHAVLLPDPNASKHHLRISFDPTSGGYAAVDLGSRNGTLLNGKRMSGSKRESDPEPVAHGSRIQIGSTVLLCHVHEGGQTCGHCEPGLLQNKDDEVQKVVSTSRTDRHRKELKNLRMMYGVAHVEEDTKLAKGYTDRAQKRRETVGSQNPHEKTQMASLDESINKENKGFKLLEKMGWKEGQSLGKDGAGMIEPVKLVSNEGQSGIGCNETVLPKVVSNEKQEIWKKTQERFQKLPATNDLFDAESD